MSSIERLQAEAPMVTFPSICPWRIQVIITPAKLIVFSSKNNVHGSTYIVFNKYFMTGSLGL